MSQMLERYDNQTGEVISEEPEVLGGVAVQIRTEIEAQIDRAIRRPRNMTRAQNNIHSLVMLDEETAAECVYALPRGGKPIKGPSVRFAEIVASQFGNCHVGSRVVAVDKFDKVVIAEGVFIDYETGLRRTAQTRRRITDKNGRLFNEDMIVVTGNAAASIAMREAILKGVPKAIWRRAYDAAEQVIAGDVKTLAVRRADAIKAFATFGITPEQIFASLEVDGMDDIGLDDIATLTAMFKAIRSGEQQVEDYFPAKADPGKAKEAAKGTAAKLANIAEQGKKDEPAPEPEQAASEPPQADGEAPEAEAPQPEPEAPEEAAAPAGQANEPEPEQKPEPRRATREEIETAKQRGREARRKGMSRRAIPGEYRDPARSSEASAWMMGFDEADRR